MYSVSLLPSEYKSYQSIIKRNDKLVFIGLIAVVTCLVVLITSLAISRIFTSELKSLVQENEGVKIKIDKLKPIEALQTQVSDMYSQINLVAGLSPDWEPLIRNISNAVSPKIGLTSVDMQYKDQAGVLVIMGNASSHEEVSLLINALSGIDGLSGIQCKTSAETAPVQSKEVQFEMDIQLSSALPYDVSLGGAQ